MPLNAIPLYLQEIDKQTRYKEDCMYFMAIVNLQDKYKPLLRQPYIKEPAKPSYVTRLNNAKSLKEYATIMFS